MRVNNISSNASFGKVFAVAGTYKQIERVGEMVKKYPGDVIVMKDATDLYIGSNTMGLCSNAVRQGKELAFFVTGKKDTDKVKYMAERGWSSMRAVSNQLDEFLNIKNVARAARTIKSSMIKG